jgi:hypothetical protein
MITKFETSIDLDLTWTIIMGTIIVVVGLFCGVIAYFLTSKDFTFPIVCVSTGVSLLGIGKSMNTSYDNNHKENQ